MPRTAGTNHANLQSRLAIRAQQATAIAALGSLRPVLERLIDEKGWVVGVIEGARQRWQSNVVPPTAAGDEAAGDECGIAWHTCHVESVAIDFDERAGCIERVTLLAAREGGMDVKDDNRPSPSARDRVVTLIAPPGWIVNIRGGSDSVAMQSFGVYAASAALEIGFAPSEDVLDRGIARSLALHHPNTPDPMREGHLSEAIRRRFLAHRALTAGTLAGRTRP